MIVTFELFGEKLQHMTQHQFGAFASYCHRLPNFHSIQMWKTRIAVSFNTNKAVLDVPTCERAQETREDLNQAMEAFSSMEPFPCPCGCGAFISVSPCLRQSGELVEYNLTAEEIALLQGNNKIGAIKEVRMRTGLNLKEAKDLCDVWTTKNKPASFPEGF